MRPFSLAVHTAFLCAGVLAAETGSRFDFGNSTSKPGYVVVTASTSYTATLGYGWVSKTGLMIRDRGVPDDLLSDFIFSTSGSNVFRVSNLDPGLYVIKVTCGDADYGNHATSISVPEGGAMPVLAPKVAQYVTLTTTVSSSATGDLDITFGSPINNWVVNALTVEPATTAIPPTTAFSYVSEWKESVFDHDPTAALVARFTGEKPPGFTPTNLTRSDYLSLIGSGVDFWKIKQNSDGAIIDPYANGEIQYSTPAFAQAAAVVAVYGVRPDLLEPAAKAMDWASGRLNAGAAAGGHDDFYTPMLAHTFRLLESRVPASRAATWRSNLNFDPYAIYNFGPGTFNWNVVSSSGEALLQQLGLRSAEDPYVATSWGSQGRHFTSSYGLYMEGPLAYDHFPRIYFADAIAQGYNGPFSAEAGRALDRAAITSLFMQSPWGELPAGGRSAHHQWNEAEQCLTYEIYAAKSNAAGNGVMAGAYKRAARLALSSMRRWVRPSGEMQIVKNWVDPSSRYGYESYSYHSQYNLLPLAMIASAYEYSGATEEIEEGAAPADVGGFVFQVDGLDKVFANAGGTYVELDTSADHHYDATGLIRIHRKGIPPQIGPSDSLIAGSSYTTPSDSPVTTGLGISWQDGTGAWRTLGEMNPASVTVVQIKQLPSEVVFDVIYSGGLSGVSSVTEHYVLTPKGVQLTTEVSGYAGPLRYVWPVHSRDGKTSNVIAVDGKMVSVTQGTERPQTFTTPGAESVRVETGEFSNHNGWARLGVAEFPRGGTATILIGEITPTPLTKGAQLVDLRATSASGAGSAKWENYGSLGDFVLSGSASLNPDVAVTGFPGVLFDGTDTAYTSLINVPADLAGASDRSIEVWAFNPEIGGEESLVSWGLRAATRSNVSLNLGSNESWGAASHFNDDLSWASIPSAGKWHHFVYVYDGSADVRVYLDGAISRTRTLGGVLATVGTMPVNIGAQRGSDGGLVPGLFYSGYINSVRVHGGALTASQVAENYAFGPVPTPIGTPPAISFIPDQTLYFGTPSEPIALVIEDFDTLLSEVSLAGAAADATLIAPHDMVFSGAGASRYVVLTPSVGASGTTTITITADDGTWVSKQTFDVTVLNQSQTWRHRHFEDSWKDESISGNLADPDTDGISNLLERTFGGNPNSPDSTILPFVDPNSPLLSLIFRRDISASDLKYEFQETTDFSVPWSRADGSEIVISSNSDLQIVRFTTSAGEGGKKFLRLKVTPP